MPEVAAIPVNWQMDTIRAWWDLWQRVYYAPDMVTFKTMHGHVFYHPNLILQHDLPLPTPEQMWELWCKQLLPKREEKEDYWWSV